MRVLENNYEKYPNNSLLFKIQADPPTVTLSRIKSIVTGNYPSFTDFFNNFNRLNLVKEDNLIE